jgi:pyridoxamine 5'-phosphate oxidase
MRREAKPAGVESLRAHARVRCRVVDERVRPLLEEDVDPDPLRQFDRWFEEARSVARAPEAAAVATATPDGAPSVRMVLLKRFDERGFVFHTNYESRKGGELEANPRAALLLHWDALGRQVRIEGRVVRLTREESEAYFRTRPRGAQIGAYVSRQSRPVPSRESLEARRTESEAELDGADVPLPDSWGGYRVVPDVYEFWQHRGDRLHDRLRYRRERGAWLIERLQP